MDSGPNTVSNPGSDVVLNTGSDTVSNSGSDTVSNSGSGSASNSTLNSGSSNPLLIVNNTGNPLLLALPPVRILVVALAQSPGIGSVGFVNSFWW